MTSQHTMHTTTTLPSMKLPVTSLFNAMVVGLLSCATGAAAQAPDAGQVLQQQQQLVPALPREGRAIRIPAPVEADTAPGGEKITVQSVRFAGNTVLSTEVLTAALQGAMGQSLDLAGVRGLAQHVSEVYRSSGYPFARAFVPAQTLRDGVVRIEVVEGRYGKVQAQSDDEAFAAKAQPWLTPLGSGTVIEGALLERVTLLMEDLPGIRTAPVIRPGTIPGTGDLDVRISRTPMLDADVGYDNHGNRYTGYQRVRANVSINSPFLLGDLITLRAMGASEGLWLGDLGYSAPLGASGLRGSLGYTHTRYEIGREFASSQSSGTAIIGSAGLRYPLLRSQQSNLALNGVWQHKRLDDNNLREGEQKSSHTLPLSLQFDHRDSLGAGGTTYGSISWTAGRLKRDAALDPLNTRDAFRKFNLDVARLQALRGGFNAMGRVSAQSASKNLDSSEDMVLAGPSGVRAYPVGEASGDEGWLVQLELRYAADGWTPYLFYDHGFVRVNQTGSGPTRTLTGGGGGLRFQLGDFSADLALAWRSQGGRPVDRNEPNASPRLWLTGAYRF